MSSATVPAPARRARVKHPVDQVLPAPQLFVYGLQHVLAFYAGAVVVPILLAGAIGLNQSQLIHLINADLFTCGIASIIQSVGFWKVGVRLPLLQGVTFTAVSPMIAIGNAAGGGTDGLRTIYGSVIVAGLFTFFLAPYFGKLIRFFPPVVTGSVISIIGIALLPVAATDAVQNGNPVGPLSGKGLAYALFTLAIIVVIQRVFRGFMATIAVLAGLVIGTVVAAIFGDANFDSVGQSDWAGVTRPFFFGAPTFAVTAIISMIVVMLITAVETTGDVFATGAIVEKRVGGEDVSRALRADGLATTIGGVLNSFPYTCFAENVGLVRLTGIKSRWVVAVAGAIMMVIGVIPKAGAVVANVPLSVLGGAALAMFATVAVVGFQTLSRVDFNDHRNVVIVATSIGLAVLVTVKSDLYTVVPGGRWSEMLFNSGITLGSITAILLNLIFFHVGKSFGPAVAGTPGRGVVRLDQVNDMSLEEFTRTFSGLFQGSAWAVERAYAQRPFADTQDLRLAFQEAMFSATPDEQTSLLRAYPDLGEGPAGPESERDQSELGFGNLHDEDYEEFSSLNRAYHDRFGFPFIVALRNIETRDHVLQIGHERLMNSPNQERATALIEVAKIVNHRFDELVAGANPIHTARTQRFDTLDS
jgi:uric acid transporter